LMDEFEKSEHNSVLEGYSIPAPPEKIGDKAMAQYYGVVNDLKNELEYKEDPHSLFVGYPISSQSGKAPVYEGFKNVKASIWTMNVYGGLDSKTFATVLSTFKTSTQPDKMRNAQPLLLIFQVDSYNQSAKGVQEEKQVKSFDTMLSMIPGAKNVIYWGMAMWEFSDEWWRGDLATNGNNVEGCPNGNAYAHTSCGIPTPTDILSLEYTGMFEIIDYPFLFCTKSKLLVLSVQSFWFDYPRNTSAIDWVMPGTLSCEPINLVIPWYIVLPLIGLSFVCLIVILLIPPPAPPKRDYQELLQMSTRL